MQRDFNGLGQVTIEYQAVAGAVNTGPTNTTPNVKYAYSEMAGGANHSRLTTITYPTVSSTTGILGYVYSGVDSAISRVSSLTWKGSTAPNPTIETISYLGLSTVAQRDHPQTNVVLKSTYIKQTGEANGEAGDQYTGLDRFGRIVEQRWWRSGVNLDRFKYGYDRDSNRLYKDNLLNNSFDELYHADGAANGYDPLNRLVEWQRGALSDTNADLIPDTVVTASRSQVFSMDAQGNFDAINTDGTPTARTHNAQNEIVVVGAASLTYDNNGNLTTDQTGKTLQFDAWNRLEWVGNGGATVNLYSFDAMGRRMFEDPGLRRDTYYRLDGTVLEEHIGQIAELQNVWSPVYKDAMILRERDAARDGTFEERRYVMQDANWNVTALLHTNGTVLERYTYDVYGSITYLTAAWGAASGSTIAFVYGHQGTRFDALVNLNHTWGRDYSPTLQTWVSMDPIFTSTNWYVAYGNNPVNAVDPWGLDVIYLLDADATGTKGYGHAAVLVGSDREGWKYYSFVPAQRSEKPYYYESGQVDTKSFATLAEATRDSKITRYTYYLRWKTGQEDDAKARQVADKFAEKPPDWRGAGPNCVDFALQVIKAAGIVPPPKPSVGVGDVIWQMYKWGTPWGPLVLGGIDWWGDMSTARAPVDVANELRFFTSNGVSASGGQGVPSNNPTPKK